MTWNRNFMRAAALVVVAGMCGTARADLIFTLADATDVSLSHTTSSPLTEDSSVDVGVGVLSWSGTVSTDSSSNTAGFSGGSFSSSDWGVDTQFVSAAIDVTEWDEVAIAGTHSGTFNTSSEYSRFFYILDEGSENNFGVGQEDENYSENAVGVAPLDVSSASSLRVGFAFSHNGSSDRFNVEALTVNGTVAAVPEPSSIALAGLGLAGALAMGIRRRGA